MLIKKKIIIKKSDGLVKRYCIDNNLISMKLNINLVQYLNCNGLIKLPTNNVYIDPRSGYIYREY